MWSSTSNTHTEMAVKLLAAKVGFFDSFTMHTEMTQSFGHKNWMLGFIHCIQHAHRNYRKILATEIAFMDSFIHHIQHAHKNSGKILATKIGFLDSFIH